jgi:hypothetical protein
LTLRVSHLTSTTHHNNTTHPQTFIMTGRKYHLPMSSLGHSGNGY